MIYMSGLKRPGRAAVHQYKKPWPQPAGTWPPAPSPWRLVRGLEHDAYRDRCPRPAGRGPLKIGRCERRGEASPMFRGCGTRVVAAIGLCRTPQGPKADVVLKPAVLKQRGMPLGAVSKTPDTPPRHLGCDDGRDLGLGLGIHDEPMLQNGAVLGYHQHPLSEATNSHDLPIMQIA
jgi:hypothetical protein